MTLCIIPARGGSKRIPRKNIRCFCGKPMISWSIKAALLAKCFNQVVVTTDDEEIAALAKRAGAEVPFLRDHDLSGDFVATKPVIADAIERLTCASDTPVCCLYATAPFVMPNILQDTYDRFVNERPTYLMAITSFAYPIQRALSMAEDGSVKMADPQKILTRSQDLEEMWHDAGQFYWATAATWLDENAQILGAGTIGHPLPRYRVQDIDTHDDWVRAEAMKKVLDLTSKLD